jgi:ATP-dependent helicase/nuclease subunit A
VARSKKAILPPESLFDSVTTAAPPLSTPKPSRKWTPEQLDAVRATGTGLLVSAAAGSGKTSVLAERCAHLVCDASPRCNVSQLLVVTFTEAAAAEMKSRIEATLRKRILSGTDDPHLRRQLKLIEHANVSTLHGFCSRLLRQHFHRVGLDPNFAILDGDEAALLRVDVVRQLFHDRYEANDGPFQKFVDAYGAGNDEPLMDLVLHTHELMCSVIDPAGWMAEATRRIEQAAALPLDQSDLGKAYINTVRDRLLGLQSRCRTNLHALPAEFPKYAEYLTNLSATLESWGATLRDGGYDALAKAAGEFAPPRLPTYPNAMPGKESAATVVTSVRDDMKAGVLKECLNFTGAEWQATLQATLPHCSVFLALVAEFGEKYRLAKREARGLDFADLERFTLDLLRDSGQPGLRPSAAARSCHHSYAHVLVDEYQDINEVQDAILGLVSTECVTSDDMPSNLFCVGDVKQSIYRFRLADPQRFMDRHKAYSTPSTTNTGRVIALAANFRSRGPLLETINHIFTRLMTADNAEIAYNDQHRLRPGATYPTDASNTFPGCPIELHLVTDAAGAPEDTETVTGEDVDLDRTEYEALFVAQRIAQLLGRDGSPPANVVERKDDAGVMRPMRPGDCVILLRSPRFKADQFAQALRAQGIPVHSDKGAGLFQALEIQDVLAVLNILDNQRQDVPLAAFLRSPLAGLPEPEDALARVRIAYRNGETPVPFHQAVVRYAAEQDDELAARLRDLLGQLERWRTLARERPLAELIWTIYDETGYLAFCAGLEEGPQRVANLHHLHERARQFGTFSRQGLYRFLRFLESLQEQTDTSAPSVSSASEDVVRVMSVHASKGLEFPVVFFPDLGKQHNLSDARKSILVDRAAYVGLQVMDEERQIKYPSLAHRLVRQRIHEQSMAEELRLLYVALTRAKEHLILVGTCKESANETWARKWAGHAGPLPTDEFLSAGTFLDWLGPVAHMLGQGASQTLLISTHTRAEIVAGANANSRRPALSGELSRLARLEPLPSEPAETDASRAVTARLGYRYPHAPFVKLPAVLSVTGWTKHGKLVPVRESDPDRPVLTAFTQPLRVPKCADDNATPSATERGSATHLALQYLDFSRPCEGADLADQLGRLVSRKVLTPAQLAIIDTAAVAWLMRSEVGALLSNNARTLRRELPFYLAKPPDAVDPEARSLETADQVMIRGRLDVMVPHAQTFTVIDYKTDDVAAESVATRAEVYRGQVALYREALERITSKRLEAAYLVFLTPRVIHRL